MNVREVVGLLKTAKKIVLGYGSNAVHFDKDDFLMMDAYGDYAVDEIIGGEEGYYEVNLKFQMVRDN